MFESPVGNVEKDRSRLIVVVSGVAVLVVIALIILARSWSTSRPAEPEMAAAGSEEFDSYSEFVQITNVSKSTAERLNNRIGIIRCRVQNTGDKVITGLQLRGVALGFENEILKETIITPIPKFRDSLAPNQSMPIDLYLEPLKYPSGQPIPDRSLVMEMTIELHGLKVK